ncbi:hypothetical protein AB0M79_00440 [Polymorphospora sp. NPDC051019]|uniref:hypothetical protein n=1 Tax=Polymorphospora sp. NPDC051019 TaxID=3155725 RepID=UPI0034166F83
MSNRSYLCVSTYPSIYPAFAKSDYDPKLNTVAADVNCVPLLWLAMFRAADLRTETFEVTEGRHTEKVVATAPVAPVERALTQLDAAVPVLERLFGEPLAAYAALLGAGVRAGEGDHVTIELEEIAVLEGDEEGYYDKLRLALASLDRPGDATADRDRLADLAQLGPARPFPPARLLLDDMDATDDDYRNHCRLIGASYLRPVPWETESAGRPGRA